MPGRYGIDVERVYEVIQRIVGDDRRPLAVLMKPEPGRGLNLDPVSGAE
jgi:hypothetical protein